MSISNWLLWFLLGAGTGAIILNLASTLLWGLIGGFGTFVLFMLLGGMDHFMTPVKKRISKN